MARIGLDVADKYGNGGGGKTEFFSLRDDGDSALVRFMYNDIDDVQLDVVHEVEVNGKKRFVNCIRSYNDPMDACPLCKSGNMAKVKMFVPVYDCESGQVKIWQRGKTFASQIAGLMDEYQPLVGTPIKVKRNGKKGDQGTTYQMFGRSSDGTKLSDLPEAPNLYGGMIMEKSFNELNNFVESGSFDGVVEAPTRRTRDYY